MRTIAQVIAEWAERTPEAPAIAAPGRAPLSYSKLLGLIEKTVRALNTAGVGRHDRVAVVLPNGPEMAAAFLGVAAGAVCAPLNPAYGTAEFQFFLADLGARALIVQDGMTSRAIQVAEALGIPVVRLMPEAEAEAGLFALRGVGASGAAQGGLAGPEDVALVLHTSGTTSRPKLVPLTHGNLTASADNIRRTLALSEADRCLNIMPLFHIHGLVGATLSTLASGGSVACAPGFYATRFFSWMEELRPTWYTAAPTMHQAIVARAGKAPYRLRFIRSSSSALAPALMAELEAAFQAPVIESYGMTEASHQMASNLSPPGKRKPGSVGVAAGPEIAILDEAGKPLPADQRGEVAIRGENVTRGYENNPSANQSAFCDGWFRTGDQGYLDSEGYLFLTGRLKELINRGGEKISPIEVDEVLLEHPGITQAVTFAIPHVQLGEDVGSAVVLREGASVTQMQVREFVAGRLAAFKVPRVVRIVEEIPKGATGKVQRIGLAQKLGVEPVDETRVETSARSAAPRTALESRLIELWREVLALDEVGVEDNFFALGGDSVLATQLIARAGETLEASVPFLRFLERPTIAAMAQSIEQAATDRRLAGLAPIQPHGSKPPLFCAGGHLGNLVDFCKLARHLDSEQPVFGFPPPRLESGQACYRLEDLAARYIELMRAVEPQGPYYLAGHCFGGLVVYEMACQLQRQGLKVAWLVLVDCFNARAAGTVPIASRLGQKLRHFVTRSRLVWENVAQRKPREAVSYLLERSRVFLRNTKYRAAQVAYDLVVGSGRTLPRFLRQMHYANRYAQRRYVPRPYPGPAVLFRVCDLRPNARLLGWEGLIGGVVEIYEGPYDPRGVSAEPVAAAAARAIEASLEKARTQ